MSKLGHNGGDLDEVDTSNSFFVSRDVFDHDLFQQKPWCDGFAWLHLLSMASNETKRKLNKGTVIILDPGDLMAAHGWLADKWGWSVARVRWFLKRLETQAMITRFCNKQDSKRNSNQIQIITICNFTKYQIISEVQQQAKQQAEQQANNNPTTTQQQANSRNIDTSLDRDNNNYPPIPPQGGDQPSVVFEAGKLTVLNGTAAQLATEFPGINIQSVCNLAAKEVVQLSDKSPDAMLAMIRSRAQAEADAAAKRANRPVREKPRVAMPPKSAWDGERLRKIAEEQGMSLEDGRHEFEAFKTYHLANGNKFADWYRAWQTWCINYAKRGYGRKIDASKKAPKSGPASLNYDLMIAESLRPKEWGQ